MTPTGRGCSRLTRPCASCRIPLASRAGTSPATSSSRARAPCSFRARHRRPRRRRRHHHPRHLHHHHRRHHSHRRPRHHPPTLRSARTAAAVLTGVITRLHRLLYLRQHRWDPQHRPLRHLRRRATLIPAVLASTTSSKAVRCGSASGTRALSGGMSCAATTIPTVRNTTATRPRCSVARSVPSRLHAPRRRLLHPSLVAIDTATSVAMHGRPSALG